MKYNKIVVAVLSLTFASQVTATNFEQEAKNIVGEEVYAELNGKKDCSKSQIIKAICAGAAGATAGATGAYAVMNRLKKKDTLASKSQFSVVDKIEKASRVEGNKFAKAKAKEAKALKAKLSLNKDKDGVVFAEGTEIPAEFQEVGITSVQTVNEAAAKIDAVVKTLVENKREELAAKCAVDMTAKVEEIVAAQNKVRDDYCKSKMAENTKK